MPTSPENHPQTQAASRTDIEAVSGDDPAAVERAAPAPDMVGEWRRLWVFLRRPTLAVAGQSAAPFTVLARIYTLDMIAIACLIGLASVAVAAGVYIPETALAGMEFTLPLILAVVIGAPVFEELAFRGWLSGKPGHVIALLLIGAGAAGFGVIHASAPLIGMLIIAAALIGAAAALITLRHRGPMEWYARAFPGFFWFATLSFALVHLANFDEGSLAVLLPLVLPQFILGSMLGYVRVHIGLWAAILLHAAHNATAVSLAALSTLAQ